MATASDPPMGRDPRVRVLLRTCSVASCRAPIFFADTATTSTPLDADPVPVEQGTTRLLWKGSTPTADVIGSGPEMRKCLYPGETWYMPHWATCTDPEAFRNLGRYSRGPS